MTQKEAIEQASASIARRDAETLLLHVAGQTRAWMLAHPELPLSADQMRAFERLVKRRAAHEPLQYLTGHQEFYGLDLRVTPDVLIPRPETELLVEAVLEWAHAETGAALRLADVGTGSGAIACALAVQLPRAEIVALDLSPAALSVAQANATRLGLGGRVRFALSDLLSATTSQRGEGELLDAVVSNPPYVASGDAPGMQPEVRDFEPHLALFAGEDGLAFYRRLIPQTAEALRPGGLLAMEFGYGQRETLRDLLKGWERVRFLDDYAGIPRVVLAERA